MAFLLCFIPTCRARLGCCLPPLRSWLLFLVLTPRLAPWAVICRRFAAGFDGRAALRGAEAPLFHGAACFGGGSPSARLKSARPSRSRSKSRSTATDGSVRPIRGRCVRESLAARAIPLSQDDKANLPGLTSRVPLLGQTDFAHQFGKARIGTQRVELEVSVQADQQPIVLLIGDVEPMEGLLFLSHVGVERGNRQR